MANPPPYTNITGISRAAMKDNAQITLADYNGNARPGELVVDQTNDNLYVGNSSGSLTLIASGSGTETWATLGDKNNASGPDNIALGNSAGLTSQGTNSVAIGNTAGQTTQGNYSVAVGQQAGTNTQGASAVAVGYLAGTTSQGASAVAIGLNTGSTGQGTYSVAIGSGAGHNGQGNNSVAIGLDTGLTTQGNGAVAVGKQAGETTQGINAVAIGLEAGKTTQGTESVAIGEGAGKTTQGAYSVAVGLQAGQTSQGSTAVALGYNAGLTSQGQEAVAIGYGAGQTSQGNNSIILNATGSALNQTTANTFTVKPVRQANTANAMYYDASTGEITYDTAGYNAGTPAWTSAGAITLTATTTNPTKGTVTTDNISYRQLGTKQWEVVMTYIQSSGSGGANGSGDYLVTLPNGLSFDTTLPSQPIYTSGVGTSTFAHLPYVIPNCNGTITNDSSGAQIFPMVYNATKFRVLTLTYGVGIQCWGSGFYSATDDPKIQLTFRFTST